MSTSRAATAVVATVGIAIAAGVGYSLHQTAKKRNEERAMASVVGNTTAQLRGALKSASPEVRETIEGNLRVTRTWSNPILADAAEQYLIGAREIMRHRAAANRLEQQAAASRAALSAHMTRAGHRDTAWIRAASQLKRQVERDHFELDVELKALADLLRSLPEANKRLAPLVQASLLLDDGLRNSARQEVLEEAKRATAELEKSRSLLPR